MKSKGGTAEQRCSYPLFRISIEISIFIVLIILTSLLLQPLQRFLLNRMTELRNHLISQGEGFLGRNISYGSIGPSLFGTLDIRNIRVSSGDTLPVMTISRVRVSYSLIKLIRRDIPGSLKSVQLDRPVITLDRDLDADVLARLASLSRSSTPAKPFSQGASGLRIEDFLSDQTFIRVRNGSCDVSAGEDHFQVEGLTFEASLSQGKLRFQGNWKTKALVTTLLKEPLDTQVSLQFSGVCASDFQSGNATIHLTSFTGDLFQIQPLKINLTLRDNNLEFKKIDDHAPFDFSGVYTLGLGRLAGDFRCEHFSPQDILTLSGPWKDYNQWLGFKTSGRASFVQDKEQGIQYTLDLAGILPPNLPRSTGSFVIQGEGTQKMVVFNELMLRIPEGSLRYQGSIGFDPLVPLAPNGSLSISDFTLAGEGAPKINALLMLRTQGREISFWGRDPLQVGAVPLSDLKGSILLAKGGLAFGVSLAGVPEPESPEEPGRVSLEGFFDYNPQYLEARIALDSLGAVDILDALRPFKNLPEFPAFLHSIEGNTPNLLSFDALKLNTEVFIVADPAHFSYNVPSFLITGEGGELFTGDISGTDRYFALHKGQIRLVEKDTGAETPIALSASADFRDPQHISFSLGATYQDRPYRLEGMILDQRSLNIEGSYGARASIHMTELGGYSGSIIVENLLIPYREQVVRVSLRSSLAYDSLEAWSIGLEHLEIADFITPGSSRAVLHLAGRADQGGASFPTLFFDDGQTPLEGRLSFSWNKNFSAVSGTITLEDSTGNEGYYLQGDFKDQHLSLKLSGLEMQLGRFVRESFNTHFSGNLNLVWNSWDSFSLKANIDSLSARISDQDLRVTGLAVLDAETLSIEGLQVGYGEFQGDMPWLRVNRLKSQGDIKARIYRDSPSRDLDISFSLGVNFTPIDSWFKLEELANTFNGALVVETAHFNSLQSEKPFRFIFSRSDSLLSLSGGPEDMVRLQISDEGDFYGGLSSPSPIRGTIIGTLGSKTIEAQSSDLYVDLTSLWRFIPSEAKDIINITGGFLTASVEITGPLGDPEFFGSAQGNSVRFEVPQYLTQEIRPVPIAIVFEGNEMSFGPVPAAVGAGRGTITGNFRFERWVPDTFTLDIQVPQNSPIPVGFDILGILTYGNASGTLKLSLEDMVLAIQGDLTAHDTEITLDTDRLKGSQNQESYEKSRFQFITNIMIRAGRKVEFIWPITEFPIIRAFASMGTNLRINSNSMTNRYALIGDVTLQSGEIFYFERSFYIREGILSFNENEIRFEPRISARAEIRDQIEEGAVTISMIIDNSPLQSFTARFESSPPLSQTEIFSILGQSITGTPTLTKEGGSTVQNAFLASTADILAQTQLFRHFQRRVQDIFALDMFSFRTQMLQNTVLLVTGQSQSLSDSNNRLGNYFDNTSVFIGKYITSDMFFQGILSLRYGENIPSLPGLTWGSYALEPDFGIELRSPFFDIRVNIAPFNSQAIQVNNISFTFTRRKPTLRELLFLP